MKFVELKEQEFREFALKHPLKTFFQTPEIGDLRRKMGWDVYYVGIKDKNNIVGATMLTSHLRHFGKYEFYSPRGILVDYNDQKLLSFFIQELKKFIKEKKGYVLRIDPYIVYKERDINGDLVEGGIDNSKIVENLKSLGFKRSNNKEQIEWMFCLDLDTTEEELLKKMRSFTRRNIKKALDNCIHIREIEYEEIQLMKDLTDATCERKGFKNRNLKYFQDMHQLFKPLDQINYIVAELDTDEYIKKYSDMLKEETTKLEQLVTVKASEKKINLQKEEIKKLEDKIDEGQKIQKEHGKIVPLSGGVFITYGDEIIYLFGGNYEEYMHLNAPYIIQWEMIKRGLKDNKKYKRYNFFGIPENINTHPQGYGVYDFKKGFTGYVEELIGAYELEIDFTYKIISLIHKIKNIIK